MAVIAKQRYKLDIAPKGGWVIVYASQHDDGAREIEFEITNQGKTFSIPASINISVQGIKANKSYFSHSCSYSGNVVTMALADDMTDVIGKAICVLKFTNSSNQKLATAKFVLNVDTDSSSEGVIIDTDAEEIFNQMLNDIRAQAASVSADIAELQSMVGSPLVASTVSKMTDHNKIYVYTGSESGYTSGNWYYWNGSAWTSGGVYNAVAINIDSHPVQGSGNVISSNGVWEIANGINDSNVCQNLGDGKVKVVPFGRTGMAGNLSVEYESGMIQLNGTISTNIVLEADSDAAPIGTELAIPYRQSINAGLMSDNANARKSPVKSGENYRLVFNMLSGSIVKNNVTYTSNEQFGAANVANVFLLKENATTSDYSLLKTNVTTDIVFDVSSIGIVVLYCYNGCTFNNVVFELYLEKVDEPDVTLSKSGKPADAKVTGDKIERVNVNLDDLDVRVNANNNIIKNIPLYRTGTINNELDVEYKYGKVKLNGTISSAIVLEADADASDIDIIGGEIHTRNAITTGLIDDNNSARKLPIKPGKFRFVFNMLSGKVTRNGVEYTSNEQFGSVNVVNAFLLKSDATQQSYSLIKTSVTTEVILDVSSVGLQILYLYSDCSFDNAVFELYLEEVTNDNSDGLPIPFYWESEIERAVGAIQSNIINASAVGSTTVCFITDCHWQSNEKHSPYIIKDIFSKCNVNYFVNGGDILYRHTTTKQEAIDEITDCINAFRVCGKPMITLYGNHDRNRNNNSEHPEAYLSHSEHANIVFKSFMPNPHIIRVTSDFAGFYWEDEFYRYVGLYWFYSETHSFPEAAEICNTNKPIIIFCHGIVFSIAEDPVDDVYDNRWILNAFEPYKAKIKCFVQGHSHRDAIRHAWETVPIISIDCDTVNMYSTIGTITEQAFAVITFDVDKISIVKVGRGEDFIVTADSQDWRQEYDDVTVNSNNPL